MTARPQMERHESALLSYSGLKAMLSYVIPAAMVVGGGGLLLGVQGLALLPANPSPAHPSIACRCSIRSTSSSASS
jgi:hypothetical protein